MPAADGPVWGVTWSIFIAANEDLVLPDQFLVARNAVQFLVAVPANDRVAL
jgi:hypothetical protein